MGSHKGGSQRRQSGVMVTIATTAVALSVAVMVITLSIIMGFKSEVYRKFTSLSGDLIVAPTSGVNPSSNASITRSEALRELIFRVAEEHGVVVESVAPYAYRSAVIRGSEGVEGVVVKGVDSLYDLSIMRSGLVDGEIPKVNSEISGRNVIVASGLADQFLLNPKDKIELLVANENGDVKRELYRLSAIYNGGLGSMEHPLIYTNIANIQSLNSWNEDQLSGYEVRINWRSSRGRDVLTELSSAINREILHSKSGEQFNGAAIYPTPQLYPSIFDWLAALDLNGVVVIAIMTIVAISNIITSMLIMVLERSELIGVLKSMGMNNGSLARIFALRSLWITLRGLVIGNGVAIALLMLQQHFNIITLDESSYVLQSVPVEISAGWLLLLNCGVVAVIALSIALPTRIVSKIEPCKAIKFN